MMIVNQASGKCIYNAL